MNAEHITLEKHLKKATAMTNFVSGIVAVAVALSVGYGFYYKTQATLNEHTKDIKEVKSDVSTIKDDIQEVDIYKGVSKVEIQVLDKRIQKLEQDMSKMDEKLDLILIQTRR
jgi:peptidoglycan hydrolase CwlO-like protein